MTAHTAIANLPNLSKEGGLAGYLAAIRKFPMLTAEKEAIYARRWREAGDRNAAYHLVTAHLRLSSSRPITGSILPSRAACVRSRAYFFSAS
jgi:RNA polymerase sigma-32 factor